MTAKGGVVGDITIGDCLELLRLAEDQHAGQAVNSPYFYQLLRVAGVFGGIAPTVRGLKTQGQLSCEQLIDRYDITCRPVRDLLVDYLRDVSRAWTTRACTSSPTPWADCSGGTWNCTTQGSRRCICPPMS
jgi:hypothetical protein